MVLVISSRLMACEIAWRRSWPSSPEVSETLRDGDGLVKRGRLVNSTISKLILEGLYGRIRDLIENVEVTCQQIKVGRIVLSVEHEGHATVLSLASTLIALIRPESSG